MIFLSPGQPAFGSPTHMDQVEHSAISLHVEEVSELFLSGRRYAGAAESLGLEQTVIIDVTPAGAPPPPVSAPRRPWGACSPRCGAAGGGSVPLPTSARKQTRPCCIPFACPVRGSPGQPRSGRKSICGKQKPLGQAKASQIDLKTWSSVQTAVSSFRWRSRVATSLDTGLW
jgi:hypothetical protein